MHGSKQNQKKGETRRRKVSVVLAFARRRLCDLSKSTVIVVNIPRINCKRFVVNREKNKKIIRTVPTTHGKARALQKRSIRLACRPEPVPLSFLKFVPTRLQNANAAARIIGHREPHCVPQVARIMPTLTVASNGHCLSTKRSFVQRTKAARCVLLPRRRHFFVVDAHLFLRRFWRTFRLTPAGS